MPGFQIVVVPVRDLTAAKAIYTGLLGIKPHSNEDFYVGYNVDGCEFGLNPAGFDQGATGRLAHVDVDWTWTTFKRPSRPSSPQAPESSPNLPTSAAEPKPPSSQAPMATGSASAQWAKFAGRSHLIDPGALRAEAGFGDGPAAHRSRCTVGLREG